MENFSYPELTIYDNFIKTINKNLETVLIEDGDQNFTGREIIRLTNKIASYFSNEGIEDDDTISILLPNSIWFVLSIFASFKVGAKVTLINPRLSQQEIQFQLVDSETKILVTNSNYSQIINDIVKQYSLNNILITDKNPKLESENCKSLLDIIKQEYSDIRNTRNFEDTAFLLYSGGTTGIPKGVKLSHKNIIANAYQFNEWVKEIPDEFKKGVLSALPLCHSFGLQCGLFAPLFRNEKIIILSKFNPNDVMKIIEKKNITSFYGVPTMYIALLQQNMNSYDLSSLKVCVSGGAALPKRIYEDFQEQTSIVICEGYGLTECSPVTHINPFSSPKVTSIGKPLVATEVKIVNSETFEELPIGEVGEIVIKGPQVMQGYYGKSIESLNIFTPNGYLRTGDVAKVDEEGYFYIVDRMKDIINSGGLKIYPREVEEVLFKHPGVSIAAVVPKPDEYFGEVGKAFIVAKEGYSLNEEELKGYCQNQLSKFKIPKEFEFVESLPLSAAGKVLKRELRRENKRN